MLFCHPAEGMHCSCIINLNGINIIVDPYKAAHRTGIELQTLQLPSLPEMNHFQLTKQVMNVCLAQGWVKCTLSARKEAVLTGYMAGSSK